MIQTSEQIQNVTCRVKCARSESSRLTSITDDTVTMSCKVSLVSKDNLSRQGPSGIKCLRSDSPGVSLVAKITCSTTTVQESISLSLEGV